MADIAELLKAVEKACNDCDNCAMCAEVLKLEDEEKLIPVASYPCKHVYHINCVGKWFQESPTCPFCRSFVEEAYKYAKGKMVCVRKFKEKEKNKTFTNFDAAQYVVDDQDGDDDGPVDLNEMDLDEDEDEEEPAPNNQVAVRPAGVFAGMKIVSVGADGQGPEDSEKEQIRSESISILETQSPMPLFLQFARKSNLDSLM